MSVFLCGWEANPTFSIAKSPDCRRLDQLNAAGYLLQQSSFYVAPQEQEPDVFMYGFSDTIKVKAESSKSDQ